ncbi:Bug family tripartite tricarboxylate transporter substrate binding protein [Falsiroseomonas tokyonensis]|uniref:Bug family tripartite tricarboxylate transporter substrate binding protein n=1 Tax=Falsiroseomonas tokyonensis TaxID=430521 RepID=A0ABV7BZ82_9PROT|nr:tripartite tricarboxylate transporter substrate-binding protein [Falsiroseomonas tokyonensis]MBU8539774.1 twin-arginine translocation pathway signal protein [Falsiroseomonas tokyonensis]
MTTLTRRALAAGLLAAPFLAPPASAQWAPSRPIRLLAPYPPGGGVDTTSRLLATPMGALLGQPVVVENRAGAGGSIAAAELARSAPDGQTIMIDALAHTVNPHLLRGLSFDYATAFTPISQVVVLPQLLVVNPAVVPAKTLPEFVEWAKARQGSLSYGSSGNATAAHLAAALFLNRAGLDIQHVPYRGGTPALQDLLGGAISFVFGTVSSSLQLARDGRLRALAVSTATRIPSLPEVPTVAEQGFAGYELNEWNGLYAPAGLPPAVTQRLYEAAKHALADANVRARLDTLGALPVGTEPEAFARYVAEQREIMGRLVRDAKIEVG